MTDYIKRQDMDKLNKKHEGLMQSVNDVYDALRDHIAKEQQAKVNYN